MTIKQIRDAQYEYYHMGHTQDWAFRVSQLKKLKKVLIDNQERIFAALKMDLNKDEFEAIASELLMIIEEINLFIKKGKKWGKTKKIARTFTNMDGQGELMIKSLGLVLIISPWNYPLQLSLLPLIGAIGAGNCAIIKPSEFTPNVSALLLELINNNFDQSYIAVVEGAIEETSELLDLEFDKIFFTGSPQVGTIVMKKAAQFLTPVVLELGGKSPTIIDKMPHKLLKQSIKRILWGKFLNGGQTCIAPDYILLHKDMENDFNDLIKEVIQEFNTEKSMHTIINEKHFTRLKSYLTEGEILIGGKTDDSTHSMELTLIKLDKLSVPLMQNEIFGPILPIMTYSHPKEAEQIIKTICPYPLALYVFSTNMTFVDFFLKGTQFGGACVNDTISQILIQDLPFGGIRTSGMGHYHGYYSYECFSQLTPIFRKSFLFELPFRYPPYSKGIKMLKSLLKKASQ